MTRVLVLQLCRLGDLLQTTPLLRGLRRLAPGGFISLVVADGFADVPIPASLADERVVFPQQALARELAEQPERWPEVARSIAEFVDRWAPGSFDVCLNLTHTALAGLLARLVPARRAIGRVVADDRTDVVLGPWLQYLWASQAMRRLSSLNLVDVYTWAAGVAGDRQPPDLVVTDRARARASAWLAERADLTRPLMAVQLGSSEERRRWPPELFAAAIDRLPPEWGDVVFVGTAAERPLVDRARAVLRRDVLDLLGRTSLEELGAVLERCGLLLTNDTGTMHVASAVGTRVVCLSSGPAFVHETGPYGAGHLWVEPLDVCFPCAAETTCHHFACRLAYTPEDVAGVVGFALGRLPAPALAGAQILSGTFGPDGEVRYVPIDHRAAAPRERLRRALSLVWRETLGVPGRRPATACGEDEAIRGAAPLADEAAALRALAAGTREAGRAAARLARAQGTAVADAGRSCDRALDRVWRLGAATDATALLVAHLRVEVDSLVGLPLTRLSQRYAEACRATAVRAERLAELLDPAARATEAVGGAGKANEPAMVGLPPPVASPAPPRRASLVEENVRAGDAACAARAHGTGPA
jgi:ADP-heptose:LPS heptosyltransferase